MLPLSQSLKLSVIIPTYNRSELLKFTLHSLISQNLAAKNYEVIVVDDGSTDNTKEVVENYKSHLKINYFFKENTGYCPGSSRNIGIINAKSPICLFVDSGVLLNSNCLSAHLSFHNNLESDLAVLGYVFGLYDSENHEDLLIEIIDPYQPDESIGKIKRIDISPDVREKYFTKYNDKISELPAPWTMFLAGNVSVSRQNLIKVGMFDENFDGRWGCEDNELGFRLHRSGLKIKLCRAAESLHYPHKVDFNNKIEQGYRNCRYFNSKYKTIETKLFLNHYKKIAISESIDINEMALELKDKSVRGHQDVH